MKSNQVANKYKQITCDSKNKLDWTKQECWLIGVLLSKGQNWPKSAKHMVQTNARLSQMVRRGQKGNVNERSETQHRKKEQRNMQVGLD